jgi:acyl-CoA synthetase (AMP-forming)/AMP-acid ligase II
MPTYQTAVAELLAIRAAERPYRVAYLEGHSGAVLTWGQLARQAQAWQSFASTDAANGDAATGQGIGSGRRIGLVVSDPLVMIGAFLAALSAGVTVAPLNPDGALAERWRQQRALGLSAVVTDDPDADCGALPRWLLDPRGETPVLRPIGAARPADIDHPGPSSPAAPTWDAAVVLASSGTTGTPKLIPLTESQLLRVAGCLAAHHELGPAERGYSPLPLFHINALVVGVLSTLVSDSSLVVDRRFSASRFWEVVGRAEVTWLNLVPAIIGVLALGDPPSAEISRRIGFARSASAPLPSATRERFERLTGIGVLETYGMTEAASQITANPREPRLRRAGSVGRPVGLEARVVDREQCPLPAGQVGQLQIRGASVVSRYWAPCPTDPATGGAGARVQATQGGWLDTGDLGLIDGDGYVYLVGRLDDVINRGGEKVFPRDVEEVLLADSEVVAAAVVGRPHPRLGEEPVAFVLAREGTDEAALSARLAKRCEQELSRFRRPAEITVTDALPTGPTGKIRHGELRRDVASRAGATVTQKIQVAQREMEMRKP